MSFKDLPEEIRQHVLHYCSNKDLRNFSLCSKLCASIARSHLWKSVKIDLSKYQVNYLQYLKHTVDLHLIEADGGDYGAGQQSGIFLSQILGFCQPNRIHKLIMNGFSDVTICYVLGVLNQVKHIALEMSKSDKRTLNWMQITNVIPPLDGFEMFFWRQKQHPRGSDLDSILDKLELKHLNLEVGDERSLVRISEEKQLERLGIQVNNFTNDISCLGELRNLRQLVLLAVRVSELSMIQLCRNLQKLRYLTLGIRDEFSDAHLGELHKLSSLRRLELVNEGSQLITGHSFEHIGLIKTLRSLEFRAWICNKEGLDKVTCLNQIETLEKITVLDDESTPNKTLEMIRYLTEKKVLKLSSERKSSYTIYTLMM